LARMAIAPGIRRDDGSANRGLTRLMTGGSVAAMFPQVERLFQRDKASGAKQSAPVVEIHAFLDWSNRERRLPAPVRLSDVPTDVVLFTLRERLRASFRGEIGEGIMHFR